METDEKITEINENLTLIEKKNGLTFGTDSYMLSAFIHESKYKRGVDLGSGTGIIPLLCAAKDKGSHIYAVEIQEQFASLIERNANLNGYSERISSICKDIREVSISDVGGEVDFVSANPPYMKADSGKANLHPEKNIARHEINGNISDFCDCARRLLKHGGKFYTVWRPDRITDLISALRKNKLEPKVIVFICGHVGLPPSLMLTEAIKGGSSGNKLPHILYLHNSASDREKNILSADAKKIYDTCSFDEFLKRK